MPAMGFTSHDYITLLRFNRLMRPAKPEGVSGFQHYGTFLSLVPSSWSYRETDEEHHEEHKKMKMKMKTPTARSDQPDHVNHDMNIDMMDLLEQSDLSDATTADIKLCSRTGRSRQSRTSLRL